MSYCTSHLTYMWRAVKLLELKSFTTLVSAPDLLLIQVSSLNCLDSVTNKPKAIGLLSLYYLTIGHVSR